jgi:hypothetical protein
MKIMKTPLFTLAAFLLFLIQLQAQEITEQQVLKSDSNYTVVNATSNVARSNQFIPASQHQDMQMTARQIETKPAEESGKTGLADASPNPARGYTWIPFTLPEDVNNAQIVVRNLLGSIVKTETINSGSERVRIDTSMLNNGIYIYTLQINNQPVESKRLVVAN